MHKANNFKNNNEKPQTSHIL